MPHLPHLAERSSITAPLSASFLENLIFKEILRLFSELSPNTRTLLLHVLRVDSLSDAPPGPGK